MTSNLVDFQDVDCIKLLQGDYMTTKLPIDVIATEKMIRGHEICLSYTDPFGFTRTAYAKFNFRDFHFERDDTLPEPKKASILDVMD